MFVCNVIDTPKSMVNDVLHYYHSTHSTATPGQDYCAAELKHWLSLSKTLPPCPPIPPPPPPLIVSHDMPQALPHPAIPFHAGFIRGRLGGML